LDAAQGENSHRWPFFLPDGKHFLYWSRSSHIGQSPVLYVGDLGTLQAKVLMKSETMANYASGHLLFMRDQTLMAQSFDPGRMELRADPAPLAEHVAINGATVRAMFSASETGRLIYQTGEASTGWQLMWWNREGKQTEAISKSEHYLFPALSRDGKRVAAGIFAGGQGVMDVWIFDLTRQTSTRLTFGPGTQGNPVWSSDGVTIFYGSNTKGLSHIYAKAADGSGEERLILDEGRVSETPRSVSLDGRYLVFERRQTNESGYHPFLLMGDGWRIRAMNRDDEKCTLPDFPVAARNGRFRAMEETRRSGELMGRNYFFSIPATPFPRLTSAQREAHRTLVRLGHCFRQSEFSATLERTT
jgi:hypothetical protein